ncbi:LuxR family transcriptional regulator [Halomonas sp. A40-4]|jgi:DNA-binding CsgD family transcriptional regulator|uniref:helix-turn-helix transcriptional regulator n=1 Tax=Halomonas sp. A40-4 TaxID=2785909 RepID=UPI0018EFC92B|nr:LuxR family transcriptional regulator [Halomonas sp. A40-4]QPL47630.1 LuxR family transcriptional regulator [Halomonas sp. A40-4]
MLKGHKESTLGDHFDSEQIDKIYYCDKKEDLQAAMSGIIKNLGFQKFIYAFFVPEKATCSSEKMVISGYPEEWRDRYKKNDYTFIDPVTKYCRKNVTPISWSGLRVAKEGQNNKVINEAKEFGLTYGRTIPLHGPGGAWSLLSISSSAKDDFFENNKDPRVAFAYYIAATMHGAVAEKHYKQKGGCYVKAPITEREREVIAWAAEGKTLWETSVILGISESTVKFHMNSASEKLGGVNKVSTVSKAILHGIL